MRVPSQRLLFRSLTLGGDGSRPHYRAAHALLDGSSHIAEYVVHVRMKPPISAGDIEDIEHVLSKLKVRRCTIAGPAEDRNSNRYLWESIPPAVQSAPIDSFSGGMVRELYVVAVHDIPRAVFFKIAQAQLTMLRFFSTSVTEEVEDEGF
ncbi:hypothetical protein B0H13DRAFT_2375738 [Mycena leptocephala]|nr:hypothetical protein B0H13DRAFT_2375738 [Mycena leptocephala]